MNPSLRRFFCLLASVALGSSLLHHSALAEDAPVKPLPSKEEKPTPTAPSKEEKPVPTAPSKEKEPEKPTSATDTASAQPKLIKITATIDGSGYISFRRANVMYHHKHWSPPADVTFDGEVWANLDLTPKAWKGAGMRLDLTKAWIVRREGRDTVALEMTPDGFDLHLSDSPNGADKYEVVLAIPQRR